MKNLAKRMAALFIALLMTVSCVPPEVYADFPEDGTEYALTDNQAEQPGEDNNGIILPETTEQPDEDDTGTTPPESGEQPGEGDNGTTPPETGEQPAEGEEDEGEEENDENGFELNSDGCEHSSLGTIVISQACEHRGHGTIQYCPECFGYAAASDTDWSGQKFASASGDTFEITVKNGQHYLHTVCAECGKQAEYLLPVNPCATHNYQRVAEESQAAGCETAGYDVYRCALCGSGYTVEIPALGHTWNDGELTVPPTCTAAGTKTYTCTVCSSTSTEEIPAPGHTWNDGVVIVEPSCTTAGTKQFTCTVCGGTRTEEIPALDHTWDSGVVTKEATCTEKGAKLFTCKVCGTTRNEDIAPHHNWVQNTEKAEIPATCTTTGVRYYKCSLCDAELESTIEKLPHEYHDEVIKEPTCTEEGEKGSVCVHCGERNPNVSVVPIPKTGHNLEYHIIPASCTEDGLEIITCTRCDYREEIILPSGHHFVEKERVPATCQTTGYVIKECDNDGCPGNEGGIPAKVTEELPIDENAHNFVQTGSTVTCTEDGVITYKCANADCTATRSVAAEATGHAWGDWVVTLAPTCCNDGEETKTCANNEAHTETRAIPKTGVHVRNAGNNYVCPSCHTTFDEVQAVLDAIKALPAKTEAAVDSNNALSEYNDILAIEALINEAKTAQPDAWNAFNNPSDERDATGLIDDAFKGRKLETQLAVLRSECEKYLKTTKYDLKYRTSGPAAQFEIFWNDNMATADRPLAADFDAYADIKLNYVIRDESGNVVSAGELGSVADAQNAFTLDPKATQKVPITPIAGKDENTVWSLLKNAEDKGGEFVYEVPNLPYEITATYTDNTTQETQTKKYTVSYSLSCRNPEDNPEYNPSGEHDYVITGAGTDPVAEERITGTVTLQNGQKAIFTKMIDWSADIEWLDDNNRSALGGNETEQKPRVDAATLKAATKIYRYRESYNIDDKEEVTEFYTYLIDDGETTLTLSDLPQYTNDGDRYIYFIEQENVPAKNSDYVPGNVYIPSYTNVGNLASKTDAVFDGGTLTELLSNKEHFVITKTWEDNKKPEERPEGKFLIWRVTEDYDENGNLSVNPKLGYAIADVPANVPVPNGGEGPDSDPNMDAVIFTRDVGGVLYETFPMYDARGVRYIYYAKEMSIPGYVSVVTNAHTPQEGLNEIVIAQFPEKKEYILNHGDVTNASTDRASTSLDKTFVALSLQNKIDVGSEVADDVKMTASFTLQKKVGDVWVNAKVDADGIVYPNDSRVTVHDDGHISVVLNNFQAETTNDSIGGFSMNKYDGSNNVIEYRWVETEVSVNGVSAELDPALWAQSADGSMVYGGEIVANIGQTSPVLTPGAEAKTSGPDDTTALFKAVAASGHSFTNTLIGDTQIEVKKYFFDENGNNISGDKDQLGDTVVRFQIFRDNEPLPESEGGVIELSYSDLDRAAGEFWDKITSVARYDEKGREYSFKVLEIGSYVKGEEDTRTWYRSENYRVEIVNKGEGVLVKRITTEYSNGLGPGPGKSLSFDVEKRWLDDSDVQSRNPILAQIYRVAEFEKDAEGSYIKDAAGNFVQKPIDPVAVGEPFALSMSNNWYQKIFFTLADGVEDSVDNYIVAESGMRVGSGTVGADFEAGAISFDKLAELRSEGNGLYTGMVGSTQNEGADWDGLNYRYKAYTRRGDTGKSPSSAEFIITNVRIGAIDVKLEKTWIAGGEVGTGGFSVYAYVNGARIKVVTFELAITPDGTTAYDPNMVVWGEPGNGVYSLERIGIIPSPSDSTKTIGVIHKLRIPGLEDFLVYCKLTTENAERDSAGNYTAKVEFDNAPKFDMFGRAVDYVFEENYIKVDGEKYPVENGRCNVGEFTYLVSQSRENTYEVNSSHRSPDVYTTKMSNARRSSYNLISNKVWRDNGLIDRPNLRFDIFRVAVNPYANNGALQPLAAAIAAQNGEAAAAILREMLNNNDSAIEQSFTDHQWNTMRNRYWWTDEVEGVEQYDEKGFPYIYFGVEHMNGNGTVGIMTSGGELYKGYYYNGIYTVDGYRPVNPQVDNLKTRDVFGKTEEDGLMPMASSVFIMADGVNKTASGSYSDFYSATVVNRPETTRTASGEKLWKMPAGWVVDEGSMPVVKAKLYRSTTQISFLDYGGDAVAYANAVKDAAIGLEGESDKVLNYELTDYTHKNYEYHFTADSKGNALPKYDEWGDLYYYYTLEDETWYKNLEGTQKWDDSDHGNFPASKVIYEDNDFNISNVFSAEPPRVEITVEKKWVLDDVIMAALEKYGLESLTQKLNGTEFIPAVIELIGVPVNGTDRDSEVEGARFDFGSVKLDPAAKTYEYKTGTETQTGTTTFNFDPVSKTLTASYKFSKFYNTETETYEDLPYYWLHNYPINYYIKETGTNHGYTLSYAHNGSGIEPGSPNGIRVDLKAASDTDTTLYVNNGSYTVKNTYNGERTSFTYTKYWLDAYVDNDDFRPQALRFVIKRYTISGSERVVDPIYSATGDLTIINNPNTPIGSGKLEDLLKYAPDGKLYYYFIYSETFLYEDSEGTIEIEGHKYRAGDTAINEGDPIGNYTLSSKRNDMFTNRLKLDSVVQIEAHKEWTIGGVSLTGEKFEELKALGVFPKTIDFYLQRKTENETDWDYVNGSAASDPIHRILKPDTSDVYVVGHTVDFASANKDNFSDMMNAVMIWKELPKCKVNSTDEYSYRVIERVTWYDGEKEFYKDEPGDPTGRGMSLSESFEPDTNGQTYKYTLSNTLIPDKAKIAKVWEDNHGSENTRPTRIKVRVTPVLNDGTLSTASWTYTLAARNNPADSSTYYSAEFELPKGVEKTGTLELSEGAKYLFEEVTFYINDKHDDGTVTERKMTDAEMAAFGLMYSSTIASPTQKTDGVYVFTLTNTKAVTTRKPVAVTAEKNWKNDTLWAEIVRPELTLKLQYKDRSSGWTDITAANVGNITAKSLEELKPVQVVPLKDSAGKLVTKYSVTWNDLYKYWDTVSLDGVAEAIEYRVVEVLSDSFPTESGSWKWSYKADTNIKGLKADGTVTKNEEAVAEYKQTLNNTLQTTYLTIRKTWLGKAGETLNGTQINNLIALKALPVQLKFSVERKVIADGVESWAAVPSAGNPYTINTQSLVNGTTVDPKLPKFDNQGNAIEYRLHETAIRFNDGEWLSIDNGVSGSISVTADKEKFVWGNLANPTNTYDYVPLEITKQWIDEENRDNKRDDFTVTIFRDDEYYTSISTGDSAATLNSRFASVTKNGDVWTIRFDKLPKYKDGMPQTEENKSVYYVRERSLPADYIAKYPDGRTFAADGGQIENHLQIERGSVSLKKNWDDSNNIYNTRPAQIYVKLQYQVGGEWRDVTHNTLRYKDGDEWKTFYRGLRYYYDSEGNLDGHNAYTTTELGTGNWVTVTPAADGSCSFTWEDLPVNLTPGSIINYRVIEGVKDSNYVIQPIDNNGKLNGYTVAYGAAVNVVRAQDVKAVVSNTLDLTDLSVRKIWENDTEYQSIVRPSQVKFRIEYRKQGGAWQPLPAPGLVKDEESGNYYLIITANDANWTKAIEKLPKMDANGAAYEYRVTEAGISYNGNDYLGAGSDGKSFGPYVVENVTVTADKDNNFSVSLTNALETGKVKVQKVWNDNEDRDGGRRTITVYLLRDGAKIAEAELTKDNNWTYTWENLPVKKNDNSGKSVYTVQEAGEAGGKFESENKDGIKIEYTVEYSNGVSLTKDNVSNASITNTHGPLSFTVEAMKKWDDIDYGIRPSVTLKLMWATSNGDDAVWKDVVQSSIAPKDADGKTVTTTSPVSQTLKYPKDAEGKIITGRDIWSSAKWENLPAYVIAGGTSTLVYYKAVEIGSIPAPYESSASAVRCYTDASGSPLKVQVEVTNKLTGKTNASVKKVWEGSELKADSVKVQLQYATDKDNPVWRNIDVGGTAVLKPDSAIPWYHSWEGLRNDYIYRVVEVCMTYVSGSGETTYHVSQLGDSGEVGGYNFKLTVKDPAECTITNTPIMGELKVTKTWADANNRDGVRPEKLVFTVMRDGAEYASKEVTVVNGEIIDGDNKGFCLFENLPVYKSGTRTLSEYSIVETYPDSESGKEYTVTYGVTGTVQLATSTATQTTKKDTVIPVTNTHETKLFSVEATKTWDDNGNYYGLRPASVSFKLQYAFSKDAAESEWTDVTVVSSVPAPGADSGTTVFTTSKLVQKLTAGVTGWGKAKWENLPQYALVDGKSTMVYYRVVETQIAPVYTAGYSDAVCFKDAAAVGTVLVAGINVTNTLTDETELTVKKNWVGSYNSSNKVIVQLQYRTDSSAEWQDVPENGQVTLSSANRWTHTFKGLRADYEYRVVEVGMTVGTANYTVRRTSDKDYTFEGRVHSYIVKCVTTASLDKDGNLIYSTVITNTYTTTPKTGDSFNAALYGSALGTSGLGLIGIFAFLKRRKKEESV